MKKIHKVIVLTLVKQAIEIINYTLKECPRFPKKTDAEGVAALETARGNLYKAIVAFYVDLR
jgi:hypothetical protein